MHHGGPCFGLFEEPMNRVYLPTRDRISDPLPACLLPRRRQSAPHRACRDCRRLDVTRRCQRMSEMEASWGPSARD
jgi:hypothetical protein